MSCCKLIIIVTEKPFSRSVIKVCIVLYIETKLCEKSKKLFGLALLVSDNQILCDGCPKDKWITKFFSYAPLNPRGFSPYCLFFPPREQGFLDK